MGYCLCYVRYLLKLTQCVSVYDSLPAMILLRDKRLITQICINFDGKCKACLLKSLLAILLLRDKRLVTQIYIYKILMVDARRVSLNSLLAIVSLRDERLVT